MPTNLIFKIIWGAGLIGQIIIRAPFNKQRRENKIASNQMSRQEIVVLIILFSGGLIPPLLYIFSPWLNFANYSLPDWAGWLGLPVMVGGLVVFWRGHVDLGKNWSPTLQIFEGHSLVTKGIYQYIRHPMYASQWLFVIAQALLLQNWLAGVGGIIAFLPMFFLRVPLEEKMMLEQFGEEYKAYMERTGGVIPHIG